MSSELRFAFHKTGLLALKNKPVFDNKDYDLLAGYFSQLNSFIKSFLTEGYGFKAIVKVDEGDLFKTSYGYYADGSENFLFVFEGDESVIMNSKSEEVKKIEKMGVKFKESELNERKGLIASSFSTKNQTIDKTRVRIPKNKDNLSYFIGLMDLFLNELFEDIDSLHYLIVMNSEREELFFPFSNKINQFFSIILNNDKILNKFNEMINETRARIRLLEVFSKPEDFIKGLDIEEEEYFEVLLSNPEIIIKYALNGSEESFRTSVNKGKISSRINKLKKQSEELMKKVKKDLIEKIKSRKTSGFSDYTEEVKDSVEGLS